MEMGMKERTKKKLKNTMNTEKKEIKEKRKRNKLIHMRFEVLSAVVMKSSVFWDITPCSPLKVNQHLRGTCQLAFNRLHNIISQKIELFITTTSCPFAISIFL
jgi:hypothetical protein